MIRELTESLSFRYPHEAAVRTPSKQTATGRKGRVKDAEAAEKTREPMPQVRTWRSPAFAGPQPGGAEYGSAIHAALQYVHYDRCGSPQEIAKEVARLTEKGFLTREQGHMVDCEKLHRFFASPMGTMLRTGTPYLREFKFSILDEGSHYGDGLQEEQVLLQGVVDCALLEEDGITVIDFKTDRITEQTLSEAVQRYTVQLNTYGEALERIYEKPIKGKFLYFFQLDRFAEVRSS